LKLANQGRVIAHLKSVSQDTVIAHLKRANSRRNGQT
jgi:hypothetical protein